MFSDLLERDRKRWGLTVGHETDGSTTQYFDRVNCNSVQGGIYPIPDADTAGP
jgi:hypothetical protein